MKSQCRNCKEIVPLEFELVTGGIQVTCRECKAEYFVAETPAATSPVPPAPPISLQAPAPQDLTTCPKCEDRQKPSHACRKCGLVFAKWNPETAQSGDIGDVTKARALWEHCLDDWANPAHHDAFIDLCRRSGVLAFAARRYRQSLPLEGADDRLRQIRVLAEHALATTPRPQKPTRRSALWIMMAILMLLPLGGFAFLRMIAS